MNPGAPHHRQRVFRIAAILFIAFLLGVVAIANRGEGGNWWGFLGRIPAGDKLGHIGLMGALSFLCNLAFPPRRQDSRRRFLPTTTLVILAIVTAEEISQAFIPARTCDLLDWLADLTGILAGQFLASRARRRWFR